jgi:hypothetical protein
MSYNNAFESYVQGRILSVMDVGDSDKSAINFYSGIVKKCTDSFNPTYNSEGIFGNPDPLRNYTATERSISVSITLIAPTATAAQTNWGDISRMSQLVYPIYSLIDGEYVITARPKVKVKLMNLIVNHTNRQHLPGYITNLSFDPNLEDGVYEVRRAGGGEIYPKYIDVSFTFLPEHTSLLGRVEGEKDVEGEDNTVSDRMATFPYGYGATSEVKDDNSASTQNAPEAAASATEAQVEANEARKDVQQATKAEEMTEGMSMTEDDAATLKSPAP